MGKSLTFRYPTSKSMVSPMLGPVMWIWPRETSEMLLGMLRCTLLTLNKGKKRWKVKMAKRLRKRS